MYIGDIEIAEPFASLFPCRDELIQKLADDFREHGYDHAHPVVVWENVLVDGNHRYQAARQVGLHDIPVEEMDFEDEDEAILYCIRNNGTHRRQMSDPELFRIMEEADRINKDIAAKLMSDGGKGGTNVPAFVSRKATAVAVGVSERKVKDFRAIQDEGTPEDIQDVKDGKSKIAEKAKEVRQRQKSKTPAKEREEDLGPISHEFQEAFDGFMEAISNARISGWKTTSRAQANRCLGQAHGLINGGQKNVLENS